MFTRLSDRLVLLYDEGQNSFRNFARRAAGKHKRDTHRAKPCGRGICRHGNVRYCCVQLPQYSENSTRYVRI